MRKVVALAVAISALAIPSVAAAAGHAPAGNAWGKEAGDCVAELGLNLGQAIQAGKVVHPDAKMTPQAIAESVHCS